MGTHRRIPCCVWCFSRIYGAVFGEKINSTWLNPDFQALWNNSHHGHYVACAPVIYNLFTGELHTLAELVLHVIQFWVYMGALLYFWGHRKRQTGRSVPLRLSLSAGFCFTCSGRLKPSMSLLIMSCCSHMRRQGICGWRIN